MPAIWSLLYNYLVYPLLYLLAQLLALFNQKIKASLIGKKEAWGRLSGAIAKRDPKLHLIWFHAPSAGEFIQLQPLLEKFLTSGFECVVTYNSISAEKWIQKTRIQAPRQPLFLDYLPFDTRRLMRRWLKLISPAAVVLIKYDLWPNLIWETHKADIPLYLVSATLQQKSLRYTTLLGRIIFSELYSHFQGIFVVEAADRQRFLTTNPELKRIEVFGDIRFDATLEQRKRKPTPFLPAYVKTKPIFILGSSWPPDEACVFPALKEALTIDTELMVIIAPHEPTEAHLHHSETYFQEFPICRLSRIMDPSSPETRIILVDSVGVLSALYQVGLMAYVGGGFTTGVHNVMEPCAMGLPVFFGPLHQNSGEALRLAQDGLAFPVRNSSEFRAKLLELLSDKTLVKQIGNRAQRFIESQTGATDRCFQAILGDLNKQQTSNGDQP